MAAEDGDEKEKKNEKESRGFWGWMGKAGLLVEVVFPILAFFGVKACAERAADNKTTATASSTASAQANPSATASPFQSQGQTQSLTVVVPPPAPLEPKGPAAPSRQHSDNGGVSIGTINGPTQINGPGAHDNRQIIHEGADKEDVRTLKKQMEALRQYSEMAKLNFAGQTGTAGVGLVERSSLSDALAPAVDLDGKRMTYRCDERSISIFRDVAQKLPKFPFSYYALAYCLERKGDAAWRIYAQQAIDILTQTTTIDGRHPNHDKALRELEAALSGRP